MSKDTVAQRAAAWLADYEDGGLLLETMEPNELDGYLLDQAYDIMSELWEMSSNGEIRWNVPNPGGSRTPIGDALKDLI